MVMCKDEEIILNEPLCHVFIRAAVLRKAMGNEHQGSGIELNNTTA